MAKAKKYKGAKCRVDIPFRIGEKQYEVGDIYYPTSDESKEDLINKKRIKLCQ
jgi:hypothetical protein